MKPVTMMPQCKYTSHPQMPLKKDYYPSLFCSNQMEEYRQQCVAEGRLLGKYPLARFFIQFLTINYAYIQRPKKLKLRLRSSVTRHMLRSVWLFKPKMTVRCPNSSNREKTKSANSSNHGSTTRRSSRNLRIQIWLPWKKCIQSTWVKLESNQIAPFKQFTSQAPNCWTIVEFSTSQSAKRSTQKLMT